VRIRLDRQVAHIAEWVALQGDRLSPDYLQADRFLHALDPRAGGFSYRTFSDSPYTRQVGRDPLERAIHGTLSSCWEELSALNRQGAAISVTINRSNGKGRKVADIEQVRALFLDDDKTPADPDRFFLRPQIQVSTSPGHYHHYWLVRELPVGDFSRWQARLARRYDGDGKVLALNQSMQLPGFWRRKTLDRPRLPGIYRITAHVPYRPSELEELLSEGPV
jgi:hypothetical protein